MDLPAVDRATADSNTPLLESSVAGEVDKVLFVNEDQTYAVVRLKVAGREQVLIGPLGQLGPGQEVEAWGRWETHKEHGRQLRVNRYRMVPPSTAEGIRRYLSSGVVPGLGPKLAERLVDHFGADTLKIIEHYSVRLGEVPGFGPARREAMRAAWEQHKGRRDTDIFLQGLGLSSGACERLYKRYRDDTLKLVRENPYRLAGEIRGIGFKTADAVAAKLNIAKDHPFRLAAGVVYTATHLAEQDGHTGFPRQGFLERVQALLGVELAAAEIGLERALLEGTVVVDTAGAGDADQALVYPLKLYTAEMELADLVKAMLLQAVPPLITPASRPGDAAWAKLNPDQQFAVEAACGSRLSIITGGPGVGKTTVTREIVAWAKSQRLKIALAAPTGRAAKRLSEATAHSASTLHRLLRWEPEGQGFAHGLDRPLPVEVLVVDEVSMLDLQLAVHLFRAIGPTTRVVLVGDHDQLPSVGPGCVLRDLIAAAICPVTYLRVVYRQGAGSRIITAAHAVNDGRLPDLRTPGTNEDLRDFYWIPQEDPEKAVDLIVRLVTERIPGRFGFSPGEDIQVLAPMVRGTCGVLNLNAALQKALNPGSPGTPSLPLGEHFLRVGDRVMQVSNNYDLGVYNGELGLVMTMDPVHKKFAVQYDQGLVEYPFDEVDQLRLAYAITIHKSQGSEFPAVVVPILTQHYVMLQRNLLYTAMTRAGKLLVLVGSARALALAVRNLNNSPRYSRLAERLKG